MQRERIKREFFTALRSAPDLFSSSSLQHFYPYHLFIASHGVARRLALAFGVSGTIGQGRQSGSQAGRRANGRANIPYV